MFTYSNTLQIDDRNGQPNIRRLKLRRAPERVWSCGGSGAHCDRSPSWWKWVIRARDESAWRRALNRLRKRELMAVPVRYERERRRVDAHRSRHASIALVTASREVASW